MRYQSDHKEKTRARLICGVGRGFRKFGFGGIGVDGLAQEAGVTSGAFYGHFHSKAEAFRAAVVAGLEDLRKGIGIAQAEAGKQWFNAFVEFYLGPRRTGILEESCALQNLSAEVGRLDGETKTVYEHELRQIVATMAAGMPDEPKRDDTIWAVLALLSGGVTLARAVDDPALSEQIAQAIREAVWAIAPQGIERPAPLATPDERP